MTLFGCFHTLTYQDLKLKQNTKSARSVCHCTKSSRKCAKLVDEKKTVDHFKNVTTAFNRKKERFMDLALYV